MFAVAFLLFGVLHCQATPEVPVAAISELPTSVLEQKLTSINQELNQLATFSFRSGVGGVGYRSRAYTTPAHQEWVQIELNDEQHIDQIVLVPCIWRDAKAGFRADGFPRAFKVYIGSKQNPQGTLVAEFGEAAKLLPRLAPLIINCPGTVATWVRVETTALSHRAWDGQYIFQLSEILVFSGKENVALHQRVNSSSGEAGSTSAWNIHNLVDGFMPYLMDAGTGEKSIAFLSNFSTREADEPKQLTIDLGANYPLSRIHYHATDVSDTAPQSESDDFGIPRHMVIEGASQPDFSDAVQLAEFHIKSIYDAGPILMERFPDTVCRYVRIRVIEPFINTRGTNLGAQFGAAEIELFSGGRNVALGRLFQGNLKVTGPDRSYSALTNGRNLYGKILPLKEWMSELGRRHDLEIQRPHIQNELSVRRASQKTMLTWLSWLTAGLAGSIVIIILVNRTIMITQIATIRERLAADLHDELGANLHTIGLLSDLALGARESEEESARLYGRIRAETERSGIAVRHCSNMLSANGLYTDLLADMQRASIRIMARLEHEITIEGDEHLKALKPRTRADLFLFYKECLVNISRHSGATKYTTWLQATANNIQLKICDNGRGIDPEGSGSPPASLQRRAGLLGATVSIETPQGGGTCIVLKLRTRRWGFRK